VSLPGVCHQGSFGRETRSRLFVHEELRQCIVMGEPSRGISAGTSSFSGRSRPRPRPHEESQFFARSALRIMRPLSLVRLQPSMVDHTSNLVRFRDNLTSRQRPLGMHLIPPLHHPR
jgi:hypothetical protein